MSASISMNAAQNGWAFATTSMAVVNALHSETWWPTLAAEYKDAVDGIKAIQAVVIEDKYSFHIGHRTYGIAETRTLNGKTRNMLDAECSSMAPVSPVCQGFIEGMRETLSAQAWSTFTMRNSKAIAKRAGENPGVALRVTALIKQSLRAIEMALSVNEAMSNAFFFSAAHQTRPAFRGHPAAMATAGLSVVPKVHLVLCLPLRLD